MSTITDFDVFLDQLDGDHGDVYSLHQAVEGTTDMGLFKCVEGNRPDTWIVTSYACDDSLFLASFKAKQAFLEAIQQRFVGDDMDVESWHLMNRAMEKDD
ncbi:hypothetical protein JD501_01850 [Aeromonas hydrophila]|uniref:hypothetical protein n=1 Tax=Aeromonas hydrophila TaxID=644 RepID=UPI00191D6033|nr:hypothetical protein [Aeromonas hydrophila]MBL0431976.1 hypothetical protein [Aeromonas hydrophila]MBL0467947.1 hypothetical protein [Aeromonas hydrophila]